MLNLVLFGPPGAGKGTQSQKLIDTFQLVHLSTGDILRNEITQGTSLGKKAKEFMDNGILVPDEVVIGMIESILEKNTQAKGFIFDGFPRTVPQAEALDQLLNGRGTPISVMVGLEVEEDELVKRLLIRGKDSGRADDQNETLIRKRIQEYNTKTVPVAGYYQKQNKYQGIEGIGEIAHIFDQICAKVQQFA